MSDCMTFPETLDEFLEQYQFKDSEEIYTNGSMLIPVFRVKQWAEHIPAVDAVEVVRCRECVHSDIYPEDTDNTMSLKCLGIRYGGVESDWFCEHGQRREDGDA